MTERNTLAHALHDIGLAAWFGGSLMGAIGVNGAAADVDDPRQRARVANAGWGRWTPVNPSPSAPTSSAARSCCKANKGRVATQQGVLANTNAKLALTAGALGATAYARVLGQKMQKAGDVPVAGGTDSLPTTPPEVAKAQKQLNALQWAIPGLTGAMLASAPRCTRSSSARRQVASGVLTRPADDRRARRQGGPPARPSAPASRPVTGRRTCRTASPTPSRPPRAPDGPRTCRCGGVRCVRRSRSTAQSTAGAGSGEVGAPCVPKNDCAQATPGDDPGGRGDQRQLQARASGRRRRRRPRPRSAPQSSTST